VGGFLLGACAIWAYGEWCNNVDSNYIVSTNDYSVNMISSKPREEESRPYHHGDLRNALIEAGLRLLEARGADGVQDDLGLRELAREVAVSPSAIYRHFPDKQALKSGLACAGLAHLAQSQQQASAQAGGGTAGFFASGLSYVKFATEHPALFRLIFSHAQPDDLLEASPDTVSAAMRSLREDIASLMPPGCTEDQRKAAVLHAWGLVHGLALLVLDRQITADWDLIQRVLGGFGALFKPT
jgi:AcrR family transcriptional regulator